MSYDAHKKDISTLTMVQAEHMRMYHIWSYMIRYSIIKYQVRRGRKDGLVFKYSTRVMRSGSCPWYDPRPSCETSKDLVSAM